LKKKQVLVSSCLLGKRVRYDGATKENLEVLNFLKDFDVIPFCPEAPLFGTPRQRVSLHVKEKSLHVITDETNKDVTALLKDETQKYIDSYPNLDMIILKSRSPSCGIDTTVVKNQDSLGSGISALLFKQAYPSVKIVDENFFKVRG